MVWRPLLTLALASIALLFIAACGSGEGDQPNSEATATPSGTAGPGDAVAVHGGLDPECVQAVLGRSATGFADITSAERTQIFSVCSPEGAPPDPDLLTRPPVGTGRGIDFECAQNTLGREVTGFEDLMTLTEEERTRVIEECSDGQFRVGPIEGSTFPGRTPPFIQQGQGGFSAGIDPECIERALGRPAQDITQLTPDERMAVVRECAGSGGIVPAGPQQ